VLLPALRHVFLDQHSVIRTELEEQLSGDMARALVEGPADLGLFAELS
jgi:hypothetical protein